MLNCEGGLTKRELEVLQYIVEGNSNAFIAQKLCVTEATVKAHVGHIFEKLKVQNRVQAVVVAIKKILI